MLDGGRYSAPHLARRSDAQTFRPSDVPTLWLQHRKVHGYSARPPQSLMPIAAKLKPKAAELKPSIAELTPKAAELKTKTAELKAKTAELKTQALRS